MDEVKQRIDKWLWFARIVRTRDDAQALAESGHVRVNRLRVSSAARNVRVGDVLTIALEEQVLVLQVLGFCARREGETEAAQTYRDLCARVPERSVELHSGE